MGKAHFCEHCGAKTVEYKFTFNKGLARCLWLMGPYKEGVEISTLDMTTSMWTNFQKLRYWGLIEKVEGGNQRKGGFWKITESGLSFLRGKFKIQKTAITRRNEVIGFSGEMIGYGEVTGGYLYRQDYIDQMHNN